MRLSGGNKSIGRIPYSAKQIVIFFAFVDTASSFILNQVKKSCGSWQDRGLTGATRSAIGHCSSAHLRQRGALHQFCSANSTRPHGENEGDA